VVARIRIAPQQAFISAAVPIALFPIGIEYLDDLRDVVRIVGDDAVVASQGELFLHQIEGGDERCVFVDHDRLFVCHVELGARPLDGDPGILELLVRLVIGPVAAGTLRVEHDPHIDTGIFPGDDGRYQTRFRERELLDQKRLLRWIDEFADRIQAVVGLDNQTGESGSMISGC
jgi:hypothetical protein